MFFGLSRGSVRQILTLIRRCLHVLQPVRDFLWDFLAWKLVFAMGGPPRSRRPDLSGTRKTDCITVCWLTVAWCPGPVDGFRAII